VSQRGFIAVWRSNASAAARRQGGKIITDRDSGRARIITTSKDNDTGTISGRMVLALPVGSRLANAFATWRQRILAGTTDRKSMSIVFFNDDGKERRRVTFAGTFPVKWAGPALNARNSGHATERLEVVFERLEMK
jgi:phage tail-like protein